MTHSIVIAPARPVRRSFATATAAAVFSLVAGLAAAQTPPAQQRPAQRPAQPRAAQPAQPPAAAPAPQAQPQPPAQQMPQLIYSPWAKFCGKGQDANAKQVCFTGKDARTEAGVPVVAAALIEPEGESKKIFRITLPSPLQLQYGTRVIVDQQPPLTGPFFTCFANGCMADYEGTPDLIGKLKKGQTLTIQAINLAGAAISFPLPLTEFAKANEGPPVDPKVFEEQQKKLQEELQKRAEEARKKLEQSGGQAPK
ncbi:invasion associated locus B family protein [Xanthobacteraceae bacterium Astr-EGSB]|uniref:invasion associated locus B family protein n=1 Tax=Astrobacterium formosum TaxID=3069710 RepID=UPI0027AEC5B8|nr:invasion associated locus B family protein [Xanthobacteraceae bacterium Astr-EGSB]